jgi:exosortase/archaeosortase family protein
MASPSTVESTSRGSLVAALGTPLGRRFALRYAAIAGGLFCVYCFPYEYVGISERPFAAYLGVYAKLVGAVLALFGESVLVSGTRIDGRFPLEIVKNCDAIEVMILFSGAMLAIDAALGRRVRAVAVGLLAIVALNVARIVSLYYVGVHARGAFESMHEEVFPLVLVALAALLFVVFSNRLNESASEREPTKGTT